MEAKLQHSRIVIRQHTLPMVDIRVAPPPALLRNKLMYPRDQDIFVVRSIENPDRPLWRRDLVTTPEEIMCQILAGWHLERFNLDTLRIDTVEDPTHRSVLAAGVPSLQHDQHALIAGSIEQLLKLGQLALQLRKLLLAFRLAQATILVRIDIVELDFAAFVDFDRVAHE